MRPAVTIAILLASFAAATAAPQCGMPIGGRVILASETTDPDVLVFDSKARLIDYVAGRWSDAKSVMSHTVLAPSGTEAIAISCSQGAAQRKYSSDDLDVLGVKITRGQSRGRYGWILATDAHPLPHH